MTLIVGIRARDGVVLGADGAATFGTASSSTIRQPVRKLSIVRGQAVVGVSGPVGLGQRIIAEIEEIWKSKGLANSTPPQAMTQLRQMVWEHIKMEIEVAAVAQKIPGTPAAMSAVSQTLVAIPCAGRACLFQFDPQGAPEEATEDLPFVAIGSGQTIADPFLAFLRRIFWRDRLPNLSEGVFATLWTLQHAIHTSPGGVSGPIQIVVAERSKKSAVVARELSESELEEHREAIAHIEDSLMRRFAQPVETETKLPPTPPPKSN